MRRLVKVKVYNLLNDNQWDFACDDNSRYLFRGNREDLIRLLKRLQAKDDKEDPASFRSQTYANIADEIIDGSDNVIYIWSNLLMDVFKSGLLIKE